jgi:hypothetical protein
MFIETLLEKNSLAPEERNGPFCHAGHFAAPELQIYGRFWFYKHWVPPGPNG